MWNENDICYTPWQAGVASLTDNASIKFNERSHWLFASKLKLFPFWCHDSNGIEALKAFRPVLTVLDCCTRQKLSQLDMDRLTATAMSCRGRKKILKNRNNGGTVKPNEKEKVQLAKTKNLETLKKMARNLVLGAEGLPDFGCMVIS